MTVTWEFPRDIEGYAITSAAKLHPIDQSVKKRNRHVLTLLEGKQIVAKATRWWENDYFEVVEITVEPDYRRRGIATAIYDTLRGVTGKKLKWLRAPQSASMRALVENYKKHNPVISDDGEVVWRV